MDITALIWTHGIILDGYKAANETLARSTKESSSLSISRSLAVETDNDISALFLENLEGWATQLGMLMRFWQSQVSIVTCLFILQNNAVVKFLSLIYSPPLASFMLYSQLSWAQMRQNAAFLPGMIYHDFRIAVNQHGLMMSRSSTGDDVKTVFLHPECGREKGYCIYNQSLLGSYSSAIDDSIP
ncbi:hypothetical protein OIU78_005933 [Salix suchowensis]|nr:hypothetical protein OIU78_005933 [Salix suchowensis]